jgi:hypothetical protein
MAEDSAYWGGHLIGDAASATLWQAPYSSAEWSDVLSKLLTSNNTLGGYIVPDCDSELVVTEANPAAMSVRVFAGVMNIHGRVYENTTTETLVIGANATGNPRIDRVVVRISVAAQTIRLAVLPGAAAASPSLPALTQTAATYEISLAYIWVANGAATIVDEDIHDERLFLASSGNSEDVTPVDNLIRNSEFYGYSKMSGFAVATDPPDGWSLVSTPASIGFYAKPAQMVRGRALEIIANGASEGISYTFSVLASTSYVIKLLTQVTAGDIGSIVVTTNAAAPTTITRYTRRTAAWIEELIYYTTEADATTMTVQLLALANTDVIQYGQVLAVKGHIPGPFRMCKEVIYHIKGVTDTNWAADTKSDGTTTIDLDADFQAIIPGGAKKVLVGLKAQDSTVAGDNILTEYAVANQDVGVPLRGPSGAGGTAAITGTGTPIRIGDSANLDYWEAQSFTTITSGRLSQLTFTLLANTGTPVGDITWEICTNNVSVPSATILQTGTITPTASAVNTVTITNGVFLSTGTTYWLVLHLPDQTTNNGCNLDCQDSSDPDGNMAYSTNGGGSWTATTYDCACTITTNPVSVGDKLAQSFQIAADSSVTGVKLYLLKVGSPVGTMTLRIETNNAGSPSGNLAHANATITLAESGLGAAYALTTFAFATAASLSAATTYWIVLSTDRVASTSNYVLWGSDASAPGYASGELKSQVGAAWSAESKDGCFQVYLTIVALTSSLSARAKSGTIDFAKVSLAGLVGSTNYYGQGWVPVDSLNRFDLYVVDTIASSLICTVLLLGLEI